MVEKKTTIKISQSVRMMIQCEREIGETNSDTIGRVFQAYMAIQEAELIKQGNNNICPEQLVRMNNASIVQENV